MYGCKDWRFLGSASNRNFSIKVVIIYPYILVIKNETFNDYPISFLAPSKINGAVVSYRCSYVVIWPQDMNGFSGLLITVNKAGNH